ncbi:methylenetetrahydrofolate reductase [NAD(P)H] [Clostridium botulinum]|uniref:methylenetetrahydrofolate reductase [NAD(P)H] n=1 Tax=Clostridium botulinum TaxID=1491 RepID=UPI0004D5D9F1|nr:methylenetetrahydrofolate reductase [NAD(P)H] [Clostridium botulinum]KEI07032.1 5,10-methylenetetrahydrofolate reductase [Clostridium botulinum C/D str. BKT75002]KEI12109.1 5,10-methylenetetrahydrofolate reductase [Clostridium botulinum C/D str. BKT2873]KGM96809.1 5,10-methylenetetrahydrofolate reductase [Clostridium botulinum D str. CCUG 7971]KOC48628.1 5,10-methylenetetrahydrofolate reductase [Clostridium botulinum]KOC52267.1 5,10-methylenetetrahydrofolate reductase [Clostridium botulinum
MNIRHIFNKKKLVFSLEVFPPKIDSPLKTIYKALNELSNLNPDFISVTYGAGGSLVNNKTAEISSLIKNVYNIEALAHLTCISAKKDDIDKITERLTSEGVSNILALRGDDNGVQRNDFNYASDLVEYIQNKDKFNIISACYPEGHIENKGLDIEIENMKRKIDNGTTSFISQLFFDNNSYYNFLNKVRSKGINVPIQAGIMPVINKKQIERITKLCGAKIPPKFAKILDKYEHNKEALRDAGIAYAVDQIIDLISTGVDGIHLYTMNNPYVANKINDSIKLVLRTINNECSA